ncbi:3'-5' exonuclease [Leptospira santarosai str. ST188]|nr:3'-5' exonuclease [Leptospira santarosai str. ST188]
MGQADSLSVDTESSGYYTYFSKVCLIQISAKGKNYILDPLKLRNLDGLGTLFENKKILKIFHSAIDDIKALKKDFGFQFQNIADTGFSSRLLDHEQYSLTYLVDYYHKIKLSKKEQKSNWEKRPLEKSQLQYAALDTVYLETIWEKMKDELIKRNLYEEALSEFEKIASEEPGGEGNSISMDKFPEILEYSADERRFIYDTLVFRDDKSRKLNKAPFRVFNNEKVILLVKSRRDMTKLTEIVGKKDAETLFQIYANPSGPPIQKSELFKKPGENLTNEEGERFKRLRIWRETIMSIRRMSHQMMPSNKMIAELAQKNPKTLDELREMELFSEWKVVHYGPSILAALENVPYESNIKGLIPINKKFE